MNVQNATRHELIQFIELIQLENGRLNTVHLREVRELQDEINKLTRENEQLRHPKVPGGKATIRQLRAALRRAILTHGHDYHCSAMRGMERDCHCGWLELKKLAGL